LHLTEYKITLACPVPVPGVCGQDCDVIYGPIFTTFGTQLSCIITKKYLSAVRFEVVYAYARPLINCPSFAQTINVVFAKQSSFCVDYFNQNC